MSEHTLHGHALSLRSPGRVATLEMDRVVALALAGLSPRSLLDIGTGTGIGAEAFALQGLAVTGVDARQDMLAAARVHVPGGSFVEAQLEHLPFRQAAFDLAFMGHVLHESADVQLALREAHRVTRMRTIVLEWPLTDSGAAGHGPPPAIRISPEALSAGARHAGYRSVQSIPLTYMALFLLDV